MSTYYLKDKLKVDTELLNELTQKSWQEIEYLQSHIANIEDVDENTAIVQLLKNLLASYYVFIGNMECLYDNDSVLLEPIINKKQSSVLNSSKVDFPDEASQENTVADYSFEEEDNFETVENTDESTVSTSAQAEPFEYFVDFDDPVGSPLTDEDLYN